MKRIIYILLLLPMVLSSYTQPKVVLPETPLSSNPEHKKLVLETLDDIYNFHFAEADIQIEKIKHKLPGHPIYYMMKAMNLDWQWEPMVDDKLKQKQIIAYLNKTLAGCDSILNKKKKNDLEVMFINFTAHGFLARVNSILGNYMDAVDHSMSAYNSVKKGFVLKEKFYDFYFSTGMYNYYREKYPELHPIIKPFAAMLSDGDPELGIKQLRFAYAHSMFSKIESANYLINIFYKYESNPAEAFGIAEEVNRKYPDNLFFVVKHVEGIMYTGKNKNEALGLCTQLINSNVLYYQMCGYFFKAQKLYTEGKVEEAFALDYKAFKMSEKLVNLKDNLPAYIHLLLGKIYEKKNLKKEAANHFKIAANKAEYPATKKEAQQYLKKY